MNNINNLIGKNILIFDLETSGLPEKKKGFYKNPIDEYYEPNDFEKYDGCRILSMAYIYIKNFNYDNSKNLNLSNITEFFRKPLDNFNISEQSIKIHGITKEYALKNGIKLSRIIKSFSNILAECDYIIGHNIIFDIMVLSSELLRMNFISIALIK